MNARPLSVSGAPPLNPPRRVYWERRLPADPVVSTGSAGFQPAYGRARHARHPQAIFLLRSAGWKPALPVGTIGHRSRCLMALLALLLICLGVWLVPTRHIADAAGPPTTTFDFRLSTFDFRLSTFGVRRPRRPRCRPRAFNGQGRPRWLPHQRCRPGTRRMWRPAVSGGRHKRLHPTRRRCACRPTHRPGPGPTPH